MTSSPDPGRLSPRPGQQGDRTPTWPRVALVVAGLVLAFVIAQTCQQSQIRLTQEQAVEKAKAQVDFEPKLTQIRLLRQGLTRQPFWVISLSIPIGDIDADRFSRLALIRIDANSGEIASVEEGEAAEDAPPATDKAAKGVEAEQSQQTEASP